MDYFTQFLQLTVALGLLNVWVVRLSKRTPYRGSDAASLKDEFKAYGLPVWSFYGVGFLKITSALLLILGLWIPSVVFPAALVVAILMIGALIMHVKVKDPLIKSLPALAMLILSIAICLNTI